MFPLEPTKSPQDSEEETDSPISTPVDPPDVDVPHDGSMAEGSTAPTYVVSWAPFESCVLRCSMQGACRVKNVDGKYSKRRERASRIWKAL